MTWIIDKTFEFCYGHRVHTQTLNGKYAADLKCACRHLHGHEGKMQVFLTADKLDATGMITRSKVEQYLADNGIQTRVFYPKALTEIPFLSNHQALINACPIAHRLTQTILALPVWPELEDSEINYICDTLNNIPMMTGVDHETVNELRHV